MTYRELVARAQVLIREDYGEAPPPATEAARAVLCRRTREELNADVPEAYLDFLRLTDGLLFEKRYELQDRSSGTVLETFETFDALAAEALRPYVKEAGEENREDGDSD